MRKLLIFLVLFLTMVSSAFGQLNHRKTLPPEMYAKLYKSAFKDSVKLYVTNVLSFPANWDTTGAVHDSITVTPYMLSTSWPDSGVFLRFQGNGTATIDTILAGIVVKYRFGDSLYVWVRADTSSVVCAIDVKLYGANGDIPVNQAVYPTVANGWQRKAFVLSPKFIDQEYLLTFRARASLAHYVDITRVRIK